MSPAGARLRALVGAHLRGARPPNVTLLRALLAGAAPGEVRAALAAAGAGPGRPPAAARRLAELRATLDTHWRDYVQLAAMLRDGRALGPEPDGVAGWATLFDAYAARSEAGSVAGYTLGSTTLLAAATAETVALLDAWGLVGPDRRVLQIGCGTGRFEAALAPRVALAVGVDVAPGMIARARVRCRGLENVRLAVTSGRSLDGLAAGAFDLVYAVDSFPYIHRVGLAARHFAEVHRVLRPGGDFVILNFAYGRPVAVDRREVRALAARCGFGVRVNGASPLRLWDARAFHLVRPAEPAPRPATGTRRAGSPRPARPRPPAGDGGARRPRPARRRSWRPP